MGLEHQVAVTGGTVVSGAAMGDMSGYTLVLTAREPKMASYFDDVLNEEDLTDLGISMFS